MQAGYASAVAILASVVTFISIFVIKKLLEMWGNEMVGSKQNNKLRLTIRYILATLLLLVMVYPYLYMVLNSFADWSQVDRKLIRPATP